MMELVRHLKVNISPAGMRLPEHEREKPLGLARFVAATSDTQQSLPLWAAGVKPVQGTGTNNFHHLSSQSYH
jgi:hypothetical protein